MYNILDSQSIELNYTSQESPDIYVNELIRFTCSVSGFTNLGSLSLRYSNNGSVVSETGCTRVDTEWKSVGAANIYGIEGLSSVKEDCALVAKPDGFAINIDIIITHPFMDVGGRFDCHAFQFGIVVQEITSKEVELEQIKVAPSNLQMLLTPEEPTEGEEFTFSCSSDDALPTSTYEYRINDQTVTEGKYTPQESDREGVTLSCVDTTHINWKGGNTAISMNIMPSYSVGDRVLSIEANPYARSLALDCSEFVAGNYKWRRYGLVQTQTSGSFVLSPQQNGTIELVECTASSRQVQPATIAWEITWVSQVTTTLLKQTLTSTSPPASVTEQCSCQSLVIILGAVIGSIVLINIILVAAASNWLKRKGKSSNGQDSSGDNIYNEIKDLKLDDHLYSAPRPPIPTGTSHNMTSDNDYLAPNTGYYIDMIQQKTDNAEDYYESAD